MTLGSWMLSLWIALSQAEQGVIVRGPLQLEAVQSIARLSPDQLKGAEVAWIWSPLAEPRRLTIESLRKTDRSRFGAGRTVLVRIPSTGDMRAAGLRLIAAPVEMWREVPESLLPSWPLPGSGRLAIPVDASRPWRLRVAGNGAGSFWADLSPSAKEAVLAVVPAPGARSALVGEDDKPVAGSSVRVLENGLGRLGTGKDWAFLIGDEKGRVAVPGLPDRSELTWLASAQGHPPKRVVSTASRLPAKIVLATGATVTGRVLDSAGRALAGASTGVEAWASSEAPISFLVKVETDAQGRFTASAVPPGKAMLLVSKSGWAPLRQPIEVPREGLDVGILSLTRGDSLAVRTVDDAGEPVAGAEVRPELGSMASGHVTTGPDGLAHLTHLPVGEEIRIVATAKGHLRADQRVQLAMAGPLELRLQRAFVVTGRFAGADGAPLADVSVKMARGRSFDTTPIDPDGRFDLPLRPAQEYTLTFSSPQSSSLEIAVPAGSPGEERDLGELRAPAAGEVAGRLVDAVTGDPIAGARIWCPRPSAMGPLVAWMNRDLLDTSSAPDGTFRLQGLPSGLATLRIEASGFAHARRGVEVPGQGAADLGDVPLSRGTTVNVKAGPRGDQAVAIVDPGGEGLVFDRLMALVVDGIGRVEQVPAGAAKVSVMRGAAILCEKLIQVPDARETTVDCSAEGILVRGAVTLGGRTAGTGWLVWQTEAGLVPEGILHFKTPAGLTQHQVFTANAPAIEVSVGAQGTFETRDLRAGTWQVTFQPEGGGPTEAVPIALSQEKVQTVTLPFPGFSVTGTVLDGEGRAVAEARVREMAGGTTVLSARDGSFRFDGLRAKTYFFGASKDEAASDPLETAVGEGLPKAPLVLTLNAEGHRPALAVRVSDERGAPASGAFVFVDLPGRGLRVLTADASGVASLLLDPPYPETVRAAARIGNAWALGTWQPFEKDGQGLTLSPPPTGALGVIAGKSEGLLQINAPGGWNLTVLLSTLGAPPLLEPGTTLEIGGLPAGTYELKADEKVKNAVVQDGKRAEVSWGTP